MDGNVRLLKMSRNDFLEKNVQLESKQKIRPIISESIIKNVVEETLNKYIKNETIKQSLNEYLDKEYGVPLYHTAQKELDGTRFIKPCWLIHGTFPKVACDIIINGFSNGVSKEGLNRQNLTYSGNAPHSNKGYSYAYKAKDFYERQSGDICYILFWSSGVEYFNRMDGDYQILFHNKNTKNRIMIYEWNGEENIDGDAKFATFREKQLYGVGNVNNKPLYVGVLGDVIKWTITNFRQYQRNLTTNNKIPTVSDSTIKKYEEYLDVNGYGKLPQNAMNSYQKWHNWDEEQEDMNVFFNNTDPFKQLYVAKRPDGEYWKY